MGDKEEECGIGWMDTEGENDTPRPRFVDDDVLDEEDVDVD